MASLGQVCIVGAFALAIYAIVASLLGVKKNQRELIASGQNAAWAATGLVLAAFYSGQQGSLLYWATSLSIFTAIVLYQQRKPGPQRIFMPYVTSVLMLTVGFMTLLLGFVASPFEALPRPPQDGVGLNPLLYDEGMRIHPPMLLAGLMAWTVPFAFAIGALATGKLGNEWVAVSRRYA